MTEQNIPKDDAYRIIVRIHREDIYYLIGIFEGYGRLGVLRTIERYESLMEILTSPFYVPQTKKLLESLKKEMFLEIVSEEPCNKQINIP